MVLATKKKSRSSCNFFRHTTPAVLMTMFWSQSETEHLDCISSCSPPCNYEHKNCTHHGTKCGHKMFTESTDFREEYWQKKNQKRPTHTNRSVIFNTFLSNNLAGTVSSSATSLHYNKVHISICYGWLTSVKNIS